MHTLFRDIGMHASLGRAIEQIGGNRFWKQLILLLRQHLPFDNALAIFYPANGVPVALEEYDAEPRRAGLDARLPERAVPARPLLPGLPGRPGQRPVPPRGDRPGPFPAERVLP